MKEQRFRFIEECRDEERNMAELCRDYGISRTTGYKWLVRYEEYGIDGLDELSRAPMAHPNRIGDAIESRVLAVRARHGSWGAPKIRAVLARELEPGCLPAESTIGEILRRHGLTVPVGKRRERRPGAGPLAGVVGANQVWCADYKGWFRTADGARMDPLTVSDAHTRYLIKCQGLKSASSDNTRAVMEAAFREHGLPERIRTDNGTPFAGNGASGLSALSVWWIKLGIVPERITPGKPQENGRHERMHRTLKAETASPPANNWRAQQARFDQFRREYNEQRPHEALGMATPASVYGGSPRRYTGRPGPVEYPSDRDVRMVAPGGQIRWHSGHVFVAHALEGERVWLEQIGELRWRVWFSFYEVGIMESGRPGLLPPAGGAQ